MKSSALSVFSLVTIAFVPVLADPTWPNLKIDNLEDILFLQDGYLRFGFRDAVSPCTFSPSGGGRTAAAEWVRTAFHDFATFDAATQTGGLDASLAFETNRAENPGAAFNSSFGFFSNFYSTRASMADLIALGVRIATQSCNGPIVPFRAGRVDATQGGVSGVPEPQHDLATIQERFAGAGFNQADMIALTACGHTLGGVHGEDFPQITGDGNATSFPKFDASYANFDNTVVTSYLAGNTTNPLVVGPAETNSDARVFGADGNVTMRALADPNAFNTKCAALFARMIDAVPQGVTLSDPIQAYTIKPYGLQLALTANNTLTFTGRIRVRVTDNTDVQLNVTLPYAERDGSTASTVITTTHPTYKLGMSNGFGGEAFLWYEFSKTLPATTSISHFNVTVQGPSGTTTYTNNGFGYPVQDRIIYQQAQSCMNTDSSASGAFPLTVVAAIRDGETAPASLVVAVEEDRQGNLVPALSLKTTSLTKTGAAPGGARYSLYSATYQLPTSSWSTTFDVVLGSGSSRVEDGFKNTGIISGTTCKPLA